MFVEYIINVEFLNLEINYSRRKCFLHKNNLFEGFKERILGLILKHVRLIHSFFPWPQGSSLETLASSFLVLFSSRIHINKPRISNLFISIFIYFQFLTNGRQIHPLKNIVMFWNLIMFLFSISMMFKFLQNLPQK